MVAKGGVLQRIAAHNRKIFYAMQRQVHARDGRGHVVALLPKQAQRAIFAAAALDLVQGRDQHAAGAAGRVIDALARLGVEHLHHQMHQRAVGVELLRRVAAVVGKLLDQVFIGVAQLILGHRFQRERVLGEVFQQVFERGVGQPLLVGPRRIAKDAVQPVRVGRFDGAQRVLQRPPHIARHACAHRSSVRRRG